MYQWANQAGAQAESIGANVASSFGGIVSATVIRSKHNWCVLGSHTTFDWEYSVISLFGVESVAAILADIGIRTSDGSVQIIASDLVYNCLADPQNGYYQYGFPLHIPKSSQLVGRMLTTRSNAPLSVTLTGFARGFMGTPGLSMVTGYGTTPNSGTGLAIDPGGSSFIVGNWTALGSAQNNLRAMMFAVGFVQTNPVVFTRWGLDIGFGLVNSVTTIVSGFIISMHQSLWDRPLHVVSDLLPCDVKSGQGLWVRALSNNGTVDTRLISFTLYGVS